MKTSEDMNNLLARHFSDEALTASESAVLAAWRTAHTDEYERLAATVADAARRAAAPTFDTEHAWQKVAGRLAAPKANRRPWRLYFSAAASLVVLLGIGAWFFRTADTTTAHYANTTAHVRTVALPDRSQVKLYPHAALRYEDNRGTRRLHLDGKAFFDVSPRDGDAFIVENRDARVEVVGTSFLVDADRRTGTGIYVRSGHVKVSAAGDEVHLHANQQAEVGATGIRCDTLLDAQAFFEGRTAVLTFHNAPMSAVVRQLETHFGVRIDVSDRVRENTVTTQIKMANLSTILRELTYLCNCQCDSLGEKHYRLYYPKE